MKNKKRRKKKVSIGNDMVVISFGVGFTCVFIFGIYCFCMSISGRLLPYSSPGTETIGIFVGIFFMSFSGIFLYFLIPIIKNMTIPDLRQARITNRLQNTGIKIWARVINSEQTGVYLNKLPEFEFTLEYSVPGHEKLKGSLKKYLGYGEFGYASRREVEIFYDPDNPKNISWTTIDEWK